MSNIELNRELTTLKSEQGISAMVLKGHQNQIANMLNGAMGQDMKDVLSGRKVVKLTFWQKLKYKLKFYFNIIINNGIQTGNSEYNGIGESDFR